MFNLVLFQEARLAHTYCSSAHPPKDTTSFSWSTLHAHHSQAGRKGSKSMRTQEHIQQTNVVGLLPQQPLKP